MSIPADLKYTSSHEWVRVDGDTVTMGISDYAQKQLGDLTFVELPGLGDDVTKGQDIAVIESVKAASDIYAPISGTISEVNDELESAPELINNDAFEAGWICKITVNDAAEIDGLLDASAYAALAPEG